jgi:MYXO-CTERM domain-containing protein
LQPRLLILLRGLSLTASALAVACSGDPEADFGVERAPIVYGEPSGEEDDEVVALFTRISETFTGQCSGTLIAPDVVLTALHCVAYQPNPAGAFSCRSDGTLVPNEPNAGTLGLPVAGENVEVHVGSHFDPEPDAIGVKVFGSGATQPCRGDFAAVVLDREIGGEFAPVRFGKTVEREEALIAIGYGQTDMPADSGRHRREVSVLDVGDVGCVEGTGPVPPDAFATSQGPCHGDSGGPALSPETGAIAGVYSLSLGSSCTAFGGRNTFALVSPYEDLIREALEFAGREPVIEPNTDEPIPCTGTGGTDPMGGGSGSREDPGCTCSAPGTATRGAFGWATMGVAALAVLRRRRRTSS